MIKEPFVIKSGIKSPSEILLALKAVPSKNKWPKPKPSVGWAAEFDLKHFGQ